MLHMYTQRNVFSE